jgi:hypothetical protein
VCEGTQYDCYPSPNNIGDSCDDGNPETSNDTITINCVCLGSYDCPILELNIGDPCDDGNPNTSNDMVSVNCECSGSYDCPTFPANIGDPCDDGESGTSNDIIDSDCNCVGVWDCPTLNLGIGYPCDDGNPNTSNDIVNSDCECVGLPFICVKVSNSSDDAEEFPSGDMKLTSNDLEMVIDADSIQKIGIRFQNISIPQCAVITNATIQFTAKNTFGNDGSCDLTIYGENSDNAVTFSNADFNISNRLKTDAAVNWIPNVWIGDASGPAQKTVDISSIIQEIVNREGFVSGNSVSVIIEGSGLRRAFSYNNSQATAPEICIEFDPNIPDSDNDGTCDANDLCDGPEPGTLCDDGDPNTPNDFIDDNCNCVGGFDCPVLMIDFGDPCDDGISGTYNDTIDSTCTCAGIWECPDYPGGPVGFGYPCDDLDPNTLYDAIDSTCTCVGIPFILVGVSEKDDDAEESPSGDMNLTSNDLEMVLDSDSVQAIGIRFRNLQIPQCAVINAAYIQFTAKNSTVIDPCTLQIYGEDTDHALIFSNEDFNISNRPKTDSMVVWSPEEWSSNDAGIAQQTPDISPIIQEIINREGFTDTSSIAFIIEGIGMRRAFSYDAGESTAPRLYIEYLDVFHDDDDDGV